MGAHENLQLWPFLLLYVGHWVYFISVHTSAPFVEILKEAKYVCTYMCVGTCTHVLVCNFIWRPSINTQCLPQSLSNCFVRHGLFLSQKLLNSSRLAEQHRSFCLCLLSAAITLWGTTWLFPWVLVTKLRSCDCTARTLLTKSSL